MSEPSDKRRRTVCLFSVFYLYEENEMKRKIIAFTTILAVISAFIYWNNNSLSVSTYTVSPKNLPDGFDGFRIVHLSDLHNKSFNGRLTEKIKKLSPDIIVISGDIIDFYHTKTQISVEFIEQIRSVAPIYYVTGNHESRIAEYPEFKKKIENLGVNILENKSVFIERNGEEICLAGVDDVIFYGSTLLGENELTFSQKLGELKSLSNEKTSILLSHRPEYFDFYADSGYDLVFSGHAHGGQMRLPFVGGVFSPGQGLFPEFYEGIHEKGETKMIVSRGLGNSVFPLRIFNRPEIIVCDLKK